MIQVTFLGTGAAFSTHRRSNAALLVQDGDTNILIECGPTVLYQLDHAGSAVNQIRYLFISHRHGDHILGLPLFLLTRLMRGAHVPLTIIGSNDALEAGKDLMRIAFPELAKRLNILTWLDMPPDQPSSTDLGSTIRLSTLPTPHSPDITSLAVRLDFDASGRSLVYTGDTSYFEALADFAVGCDLLVHEANFSETLEPGINPDVRGGHSTARQAGRTASRAGSRILALVHLSPKYLGQEGDVRADAAQEFHGRIIVPNDGATVYL